MANWSDTHIDLEGENAEYAYKKIEAYLNDDGSYLCPMGIAPDDTLDSSAGYGGMEICDISLDGKKIEINGSGRWCAPHAFFQDLASDFELDMEYIDEEGGCDFFHRIVYEKGGEMIDEESSQFSQESITYHGVNYFVERNEFIADNENWEEDYSNEIKLFDANGVSLEELKKAWGI